MGPNHALSRRELLRLAGVVAAGAALDACAPTRFLEPQGQAEPEVTTADEALQRLIAGNQRRVAGTSIPRGMTAGYRAAPAQEQHPFAVIHGCSDARVSIGAIFDQGIGDVYTTRVAGNILDDAVVGSMEFAVMEFKVPLIMVLGHSQCGAVAAAVDAVENGGPVPGHMKELVQAIKPAVAKASVLPGDVRENASRANVEMVVSQLRSSPPILAESVQEGRLRIVGAYCDLQTGVVELTVP